MIISIIMSLKSSFTTPDQVRVRQAQHNLMRARTKKEGVQGEYATAERNHASSWFPTSKDLKELEEQTKRLELAKQKVTSAEAELYSITKWAALQREGFSLEMVLHPKFWTSPENWCRTAAVVLLIFMIVLLIGAWYRRRRHRQAQAHVLPL